jgi:hypothetical protein
MDSFVGLIQMFRCQRDVVEHLVGLNIMVMSYEYDDITSAPGWWRRRLCRRTHNSTTQELSRFLRAVVEASENPSRSKYTIHSWIWGRKEQDTPHPSLVIR